jgi:hypothetical protein
MTTRNPAPTHLTPTQALRWRTAARALDEAGAVDINRLPDATRTITFGRLRGALADMMALLQEVQDRESAHRQH